jgi:DNA-binding GntR family transcriptional regulator
VPGQAQPPEPATLTPISDYSALNLSFHQRIVDLAHSELFSQHISRLKIHMRAIRQRTIGEHDRWAHSVMEHARIIAALRARDADLVEARVRQHAVGLAEHVKVNVSYLK